VSEKLWLPLRAGSVPIYLGATDISEGFLPHKDAALLMKDFDSLDQLAEKVKELNSNNIAYKKMLRHKRK